MIQVIMCPVDRSPYVTNISNKLETMQKIVGGYIETVTIGKTVIVCNEEGRLTDLPENPSVPGFVGTVFICGFAGDEFADIDPTIKKELLAKQRWAKPVKCKKCRWWKEGWCTLLKIATTKDWFCGSAWRKHER